MSPLSCLVAAIALQRDALISAAHPLLINYYALIGPAPEAKTLQALLCKIDVERELKRRETDELRP